MGSDSSDETLLANWQAGKVSAFEALYARYRQSLFLFLLRRGHDRAAAEDVFHDCWLKVIHAPEAFTGDNFRAWIFTVARNLSIDRFRQHQRHAEDMAPEQLEQAVDSAAQRRAEGIDCIELMKQGIAALPMDQRDAFLLREEAGLGLEQLAELMQAGRETIKSRLRYATQRLRALLEDCL
jgi:RNA polymerase sigma-70 factor (ECF subfamily)